MVFFSTILGSWIIDSAGKPVGKVADFLIATVTDKQFPAVCGIITTKNEFISASAIKSWEPKIQLKQSFSEAISPALPEDQGLIKLAADVLDKQIVDLAGQKVVRANDLQLGQVQEEMCLVAIDISNRALLRRLGLRMSFFDIFLKPHFLEWKDINLIGNQLHLATGVAELVKLHPADLANIIEKLNIYQGSILLQSLDQETAAKVLQEVQPAIQKLLIKNLGADRAVKIMDKMSTDELVDLIQLLPSRESREIIHQLPFDAKAQKISKILEYDEDTAGGLMTTEYLTTLPTTTVKEAMEEVRQSSHTQHSIQFIYVVNPQGQFLGVISLRNLIVAKESQIIQAVMKKRHHLPIVRVNQSLTEVAVSMTKYNLLSVVVVDKNNILLGIITADDIMRRFIPEA